TAPTLNFTLSTTTTTRIWFHQYPPATKCLKLLPECPSIYPNPTALWNASPKPSLSLPAEWILAAECDSSSEPRLPNFTANNILLDAIRFESISKSIRHAATALPATDWRHRRWIWSSSWFRSSTIPATPVLLFGVQFLTDE